MPSVRRDGSATYSIGHGCRFLFFSLSREETCGRRGDLGVITLLPQEFTVRLKPDTTYFWEPSQRVRGEVSPTEAGHYVLRELS
ncbi:MAG: hypothetical protein ACRD3C_07675 [Vicinamibacterales bacterium]